MQDTGNETTPLNIRYQAAAWILLVKNKIYIMCEDRILAFGA
jgi:hypothetical protein